MPLSGFFHVATSSTALTSNITGYTIEGRQGKWSAAEEIWIDGQNFLLMQSYEYGKEVAYAVLDSHGKQAAEDTQDGFTDQVIEQIREYIHGQKTPSLSAVQEADKRPDLGANILEATNIAAELVGEELSPVQKMQGISSRATNAERAHMSRDEEKEHEARQRRKKRRKNGRLPLKGRDSVLDRLKKYQEKLRENSEAIVTW